MIKLAPSMLSADFAKLKEEIAATEKAGAQYLHLDIMDGHFVPNISYGPAVVKDIRPHSKMIFDVHLMIYNPEKYAPEFAKAGADIITVHAEATNDLPSVLLGLRELGVSPAVSIKPDTPVSAIIPVLHLVDMVLVMTVYPGFGGQSLIEDCLPKLTELANIREQRGLKYTLEIDGGVKLSNLDAVLDAGAEIIVAGSAIFDRRDPAARTKEFMDKIGEYKK
ncbi:MAG: ribulose-phosphate 3-epimerase [Firmicutes bacterium]|nr:ribulose-phosphate 3-epimerase [Bacillota bacterium]